MTNVFAWGAWPYRLAAEAALKLGDIDLAAHYARLALRATPGDAEVRRFHAGVVATLRRPRTAAG